MGKETKTPKKHKPVFGVDAARRIPEQASVTAAIH
jgi:hypothetical protein